MRQFKVGRSKFNVWGRKVAAYPHYIESRSATTVGTHLDWIVAYPYRLHNTVRMNLSHPLFGLGYSESLDIFAVVRGGYSLKRVTLHSVKTDKCGHRIISRLPTELNVARSTETLQTTQESACSCRFSRPLTYPNELTTYLLSSR
jgi:hypothetical protein